MVVEGVPPLSIKVEGAQGGGGGREATDGPRSGERVRGKGKRKRPPSGYELPELTAMCGLVSDLGHEDDRCVTHNHTCTNV